MIKITNNIVIDEDEISEKFIRSTGPGGQNVNKVETAVQIRFDACNSATINDMLLQRLKKLAGQRMTVDGTIIITANRFRSQLRNRTDATERLVELIRKASIEPKVRKRSKPSKGSQLRRLATKKQQSTKKQGRSKNISFD